MSDAPPTNPIPVVRPRGRTEWLDAARGIAILLVVLLHATEWLDLAGFRSDAWTSFHEIVTGLRMPLFFAVSGLLATRWLTAGWRELFTGRLQLLIWCYLVWQVVGSASALVAARITGDELTPVRMAASLAASVVRPRFELWFLWALVLFLVLARASRRIPVPYQLAGAAIVSAFFLSDVVPIENLGWDGVGCYYLFFLIGIHHKAALLAFAHGLDVARSLAILGAWAVIAVGSWALEIEGVLGVELVVRTAGLFAGIALAVRLAGLRPLRSLGSRTLPVYLAHTPLIVVFVWVMWSLDLPGPPWLMTPPLAALAIAASLGLHTALSRTWGRFLYEPPTVPVRARRVPIHLAA